MFHFDFGISSINGEPIKAQLIEAFPATMGYVHWHLSLPCLSAFLRDHRGCMAQ